ncbi:MAG: hypothetical protein GY723_15925 [bacterium]|nr:hypothetical protein [bacterium]
MPSSEATNRPVFLAGAATARAVPDPEEGAGGFDASLWAESFDAHPLLAATARAACLGYPYGH